MNVNLELYKIFYKVAKAKSISKAANELYLSRPAVTQAVHHLEQQLGATLFVRTKKGTELTEEAKELFYDIEQALILIQNGENKFRDLMKLQSGTLRIGASTTLTQHVVLTYLTTFCEQYPKIDITITNHLTSELVKLLKNGTLDLLVVNLPMKEEKELKILPFAEVTDTFVVGKAYQFLTEQPHTLEDLSQYPFIFQKSPSNTRSFLDQWLAQQKMEIKPKFEVVSYNLGMKMTASGLGIGYATREFIQDSLQKKELYELTTIPTITSRKLGIVLLKNRIPSFASRKFLDLFFSKTKVDSTSLKKN